MKKIIVITISLLFAMLVALGEPALHHAAEVTNRPQIAAANWGYTLQASGQELTITFNQTPAAAYTVEVYDLTGKRVANWSQAPSTSQSATFTFDNALKSGLYVARVTLGKEVVTKKFQL